MAVIPTGAIYKSLVFDGEDSRDYGVYITGQAVYNAPERDVEMISIPGRNGSFALDKGRFQNIEVSYPAGIFADNETDFAEAISDFRNLLCSRNGYVRLSDEYHPDEYRMAVYKSGLEVEPAQLKAGEFNIVFDCKPQRYLTSGEEAIDVDSGDIITNPTLFEASPMLEVEGYGTIVIGGEDVTIQNSELGKVKLSGATSNQGTALDVSLLETGDSIYSVASGEPYTTLRLKLTNTSRRLFVSTRAAVTGGSVSINRRNGYTTDVKVIPDDVNFVKGTNKTIVTTVPLAVEVDGTTSNVTLTLTTTYNSSTERVAMSMSRSGFPSSTFSFETWYYHPAYYGDSTKTLLPPVMYIDLDLGEAYGEVSGETISFNNLVSMPAELPKLKVGDTGIAYDNTITDLKVVPRWWKI